MLVLSRKVGEEIIVDGNIKVKVVDIRGGKVRLGIEAPPHITVHREEVAQAMGLSVPASAIGRQAMPA